MAVPTSVVVAGILVLIVAAFAIYVVAGGPLPWRIFATVIPANASTTQFAPLSQWTQNQPVADASCHGYFFPTTTTPIAGGNGVLIHLGSPSLNNLDEAIYSETPFQCVDTDTVNAIQEYHTCTRTLINGQETNSYPTSQTLCPRQDGTNASYGETLKRDGGS